jgi:hypothetical protein
MAVLERFYRTIQRAWGRVRWRMAAIILLTGSSTLLFAALGVVIVNVVLKRESANVAEKQIQMLVQASRSIAPAVLDNIDGCTEDGINSGRLKPLLAYMSDAFPGARISIRIDGGHGMQLLPPQTKASEITKPEWLPQMDFTGLVADNGQVEIRNLADANKTNVQ